MLTALSNIICVAHLAKANRTVLNAASEILNIENAIGVDIWSEMGLPLHEARLSIQATLDEAIIAIGIEPEQRWAIGRATGHHTKRFEWEPWPT